jgi:hypothetical protein
LDELGEIAAIDASAGSARTPRTRYLAANAALVLAEQRYDAFVAIKLEKPFEVNVRRKQDLMKTATQSFNKLVDYELGEFTAAATFYLAEIYGHFSKALMTSERPEGLSPSELEQYELGLEEQAYPFEEKAIEVHESNLKLISRGVYNGWVEKSLQKLAELVPVRYDKPEETSGIVSSLETYIFAVDRPAVTATPQSEVPIPAASETAGSVQVEEREYVTDSKSPEPAQVREPDAVRKFERVEPLQTEKRGSVTEPRPAETKHVKESAQDEEPVQTEQTTDAGKHPQR